VNLHREDRISHHQLAEALGLSRLEAEGVLKRHKVSSGVTAEETRPQAAALGVGIGVGSSFQTTKTEPTPIVSRKQNRHRLFPSKTEPTPIVSLPGHLAVLPQSALKRSRPGHM
jgi:hypothetical protein